MNCTSNLNCLFVHAESSGCSGWSSSIHSPRSPGLPVHEGFSNVGCQWHNCCALRAARAVRAARARHDCSDETVLKPRVEWPCFCSSHGTPHRCCCIRCHTVREQSRQLHPQLSQFPRPRSCQTCRYHFGSVRARRAVPARRCQTHAAGSHQGMHELPKHPGDHQLVAALATTADCDAGEPSTAFLVKEQAHWLLVLDRLCLLRSRMCLHKRLHNGLLPDLDTVSTGCCPHEARLLTCFPVQG